MNHSRQYIILVALAVAIGGFLLGFDVTVNSGTVSFLKSFGLMAVATLVFVLIWIPQTKGKTIEELEGLLVRK